VARDPDVEVVRPTPSDDPAGAVLAVVRELVAEVHSPALAAATMMDSSLDRELGLGSLELVELLGRLEDAFGVRLDTRALATAATPRDLLDALRHARPAPPGRRRTARVGARRGVVTPAGARPAAPGSGADARPPAAPEAARTLVEAFDWHVRAGPDRLHIRILGEDGPDVELTYASLLHHAESAAAGLRSRDLVPGDRVALMLPTGPEYFATFLGVLLAGGVPVPLYPPARPSQLEDHLRRQVGILDNAGATLLVTPPDALPLARLVRSHVATLSQVVSPAALALPAPPPARPLARSSDLALLQYTSGSTGSPKGVMLTHANLLANIRSMGRAAAVDPSDVFVSWLPLYHDMGLIGAWLTSLYHGLPLTVMSPVTFLARPIRWLEAIDEYGGTLSGGPNFGFELCLRAIRDDDLRGLDLSSWRFAFNGAEPVRAETVSRFSARFAACGLRPEAITPVYGLAEASVGLTFPPPGRGPVVDRVARDPLVRSGRAVPVAAEDAAALEFVACGYPLPGHEVRVVDAAGAELGEREEGRIEFRGPSATSGYFDSPAATAALFHGDWLDTGDLGYLVAGDLYVTGRVKDLIIRAGRNLHPEELEQAVGAIPGVRTGCVAAFAGTDPVAGTERLVILAETRETDADAREALRERIMAVTVDLLGTPPDDVVLAPPGTVPKTSSGKIRRAASRERYEHGTVGRRRRAAWWQITRFAWAGWRPRLRRLGRAATGIGYSSYVWTVAVVIVPPLLVLLVVLPRLSWRVSAARRGVGLLIRLSGTPLVIEGTDRITPLERCVVVANHASFLDGFVLLAAIPGPLCFVAGEVFTRQLLAGFVLRRIGAEFVERTDRERGIADTQRLVEAARAGRRLVFFPEGGLARAPGLRPFHLGAFVTAVSAGDPVVPVAIRGTRSMLRAGHRVVRRGAVRVVVEAPLLPSGAGFDAAAELERAARAAILPDCGEPDVG